MNPAAAMHERPDPILAWLRLMRVSNAPTVITNAMVGMALAMKCADDPSRVLQPGFAAMAGCVLVYLAGMMMNDIFDQPIDRIERPGRPIVSGAVSEQTAIVVAMALLASGVVSLAWTGSATIPWMLLLVSCVLAYDMLHRSVVAGPSLMAACRALVPTIVAIAASPGHQPPWFLLGFFALPLAGCTLSISLAARNEAVAGSMPTGADTALSVAAALMGAAAVMPLGAVALGMLPPTGSARLAIYACCLMAAGWMVVRGMFDLVEAGRAPRGVMTWIAAMSVIDSGSLLLLGQPTAAAVAAGCAVLTRLMQRSVAGS